MEKLEELRREGAIIGAVTNGNADVFSVKKIGHLFDFDVRSEDVGVAKPNLEMFRKAVEVSERNANKRHD